jgi:hypothetical protein
MPFNESKLNAAIEIAKNKAAGNRALLNAIDKAAQGLRGGWIATELNDLQAPGRLPRRRNL